MMDAYAHLDMNEQDPISDLERRMDAAGVRRALVVETWKKNNRACLDSLIASRPSRFRVALCFRPEEGELETEALQSNVFCALRVRTADIQALGVNAERLNANGKWLLPHSETGIGALAKELIQLTQCHPGLKIFVPHLCWPKHGGEEDGDWYESVSRLNLLPNIVVGVSAIAHFSREPFPHKDVEPFATHLRKIFGVESLVAASDYPLFEKSRYAEYMQLAVDWIGPQDEQTRHVESVLWGDNSSLQNVTPFPK
jgi:predicted TIM-barrel fold metal-dependent hydrolase